MAYNFLRGGALDEGPQRKISWLEILLQNGGGSKHPSINLKDMEPQLTCRLCLMNNAKTMPKTFMIQEAFSA